ncbi:hypothetical protein CsSME_00012298 [Camellia sinensis var. sinensis]
MAEDEVLIEVDAVQAVYGDDCVVLETYPPHLHVHIKPRTADVSSQQFVEAVLTIRAGPQYPNEPPNINIIESKGLDEQRQKHLITGIRDKACELSSCLMLVALCEEAVERLSSMNHPDGNCPLCLYSLVEEDAGNNILPFMKLMSCFHCFHCECIIRWWNWLQSQKEIKPTNSSGATVHASTNTVNQRGNLELMDCRKYLCTQLNSLRWVFGYLKDNFDWTFGSLNKSEWSIGCDLEFGISLLQFSLAIK